MADGFQGGLLGAGGYDPALLGLASGLLAGGAPQARPAFFGQALGQGLLQSHALEQEARAADLRARLINAQVSHLGTQDYAALLKAAQTLQAQQALAAYASGAIPTTGPDPLALATGAAPETAGPVGPTPARAVLMTAGQATPQVPNWAALGAAGVPPEMISRLQEQYRIENPNLAYQGGVAVHPTTGRPVPGAFAAPQKVEGVMGTPRVDPVTGQITYQAAAGSAQLYGQTRDIEAQAANRYMSPAERARLGIEGSRLYWETGLLPPTLPTAQGAPQGAPGAAVAAPPAPARPTPPPVAAPQAAPAPALGSPGATLAGPGPRPEGVTPKEWAERIAKAPENRQRMETLATQLKRLEIGAEALRVHKGLWGVTGVSGVVPDFPGSAAANARADLKALTDQIASAALQTMREMSKTGGALGQASDRDIDLMRNQLGALSTSKSTEALRDALLGVEGYAREAIGRMQGAYDETYNIRRAPAPRPPAPIVPPGARMPGGAGDLDWGALTRPGGR